MKTCKKEGCNYPVFSHLYCKSHQYLRIDNNKPKAKMNNHPTLIQPSVMAESLLFKMIWAHSDKKSFLTNVWLRDFLNTPLWYSCFAHVLPKGLNKYPYFKLYARNIVIVTPDEHHLIDNGTDEQRISYALDVEEHSGGRNTANWNRLKVLEAELRAEYLQWFPSTRGMMIGCKYSEAEVVTIVGALNNEFFHPTKK